MIGAELTTRIREEAARQSLVLMSEAETTELLSRIVQRFNLDDSRVWWWERLVPQKSESYEESECLRRLGEYLSTVDANDLVLVATDDESPPWVAVNAQWSILRRIVEELPFFEFFIVDKGLTWIIFDTHLNTLVMGGALIDSPL